MFFLVSSLKISFLRNHLVSIYVSVSLISIIYNILLFYNDDESQNLLFAHVASDNIGNNCVEMQVKM